jgi:diguanylate cyclase (GGDEF)-like protein/PAS domain S-box-containing protein
MRERCVLQQKKRHVGTLRSRAGESELRGTTHDGASVLLDAIESMPQGLCMFDVEGRLLVCNSRYAGMYGMSEQAVLPGMTIAQILERRIEAGVMTQQNADRYIQFALTAIGAKKATQTLTELVDGRTIAIEFRPLGTGGWVATHEDITERVEMEARLAQLARQDALTQLPNGAQLREKLQQWLDEDAGNGLSLLHIDLDDFKEVNDALGRAGGDALLKQAADRLRGVVRGSDFVAPLDGDSFTVVCPHADPAETSATAEKVLRSLSAPFVFEEQEVFIGASIGIGVADSECRDMRRLMQQADAALRRAKSDGRGTYRYFEHAMHERAQTRRQLALDLRKALPRGEFQVFYQPIVSIATQEIVCFEALLRWNHPVRGRVAPDDFIPLAEEAGLINTIGEWVLRQACAQCATWPSHIRVAVNVSAVQFGNRNLVASVAGALAAAGLAADRLEIEITESCLLLNDDATLDLLHRLRALGVRIAMDDFGTGYSALSYLPRFPFDKIKIDRCFLQDRAISERSGRMLEAIAAMAGTLKIVMTVEGVETPEQLARIRALGCTEMQGFFFGRPMTACDAEALIASEATACHAA